MKKWLTTTNSLKKNKQKDWRMCVWKPCSSSDARSSFLPIFTVKYNLCINNHGETLLFLYTLIWAPSHGFHNVPHTHTDKVICWLLFALLWTPFFFFLVFFFSIGVMVSVTLNYTPLSQVYRFLMALISRCITMGKTTTTKEQHYNITRSRVPIANKKRGKKRKMNKFIQN